MNETQADKALLERARQLDGKLEPDAILDCHSIKEDYIASIAVSLKRIADYLEQQCNRVDELGTPRIAAAREGKTR